MTVHPAHRATTSDRPKASTPPRFHEGIRERLLAAGHGPEAAQALLDLDAQMFHWARMVAKGEMKARLIADLRLGLEPAQFDALTAIIRIEGGIGRAAEPATIGLLADEMAIDPSRASRIAADLIAAGYLVREAVQEDGRKSALRLTEPAVAAFRAFRDAKWDLLDTVFADWSPEDITQLAALFGRYSAAMRAVLLSRGSAPDAP